MQVAFVVVLVVFPRELWALTTCTAPSVTTVTKNLPDYYWRDYFGVLPPDAIPGGTDASGNPTYIGHAYIRNFEFLPVTIFEGCNVAKTSAYGKEMDVDKNIQVLCGRHPHKFAWISTKNEEAHLLTNCHFVVGGSEVGQTLNIARVNHDGRTVIGKVFSNPLSNRGLWIPNHGGELNFLTYEILTYGCQEYAYSVKDA